MRTGYDWLAPLRHELDAAPHPYTFFFRDDDAGWSNEQLAELLALFAHYAVPLDVAVIPAALDAQLARRLRRQRDMDPRLLSFHQHGFSHTNHERSGRPCEFGPTRSAHAQRRDIAAGAVRLRELLGEIPPIFTPPWNRCTEATGRCLLQLGFQALVRDTSAARLDLAALQELEVSVDWPPTRRGRPLARSEAAELVAAACRQGPVGVMLHHATIGPAEQNDLEELLGVLAHHGNVRSVLLSELLERSKAPKQEPVRG